MLTYNQWNANKGIEEGFELYSQAGLIEPSVEDSIIRKELRGGLYLFP